MCLISLVFFVMNCFTHARIFFGAYHRAMAEGRVALEPISFTSNFWRAKNWQKIGKFQILAVVALDQNVFTKISLIDMYGSQEIYRQQNV